MASVVRTAGGNVECLEKHEGIMAPIWVSFNDKLQTGAVYISHSEGCIARTEALLEAVMLHTGEHAVSMVICM